MAVKLSKAVFGGDEKLASQLIRSSEPALSQSDCNIALQACSLFNVPSLVEGLLERGASLAASTYNKRTPLHFAARYNCFELTKFLIEHGATIQMVDISGYTPLDLSLGCGLANIEIMKYLVENGALATQGRDQDRTPMASIDSTLEGRWEGTYTYNSWKKGDVDPTAMTIQFDPISLNSQYPIWKCNDGDEIGPFEVLGHLLADNTFRFLKLYESMGWLYLGDFDADTMIIRGTWGSSMTLRHGSFEMKKVEPLISEH